MERQKLEMLLDLLEWFRDEAIDREEWEKRESVRFDVEFELKAVR